jgi:nicotinate phosphoribosyltransferase
MNILSSLYGASLSLLTDLYLLTMAHGYWKTGKADCEAAFHLFYRRNPFEGGFAVAAGLAVAAEFIEQLRFDSDDLAYLATLEGNDGRPLFEPAFLEYLGKLEWACDVDAVPEGTLVFPYEPLVRVCGPLVQAQLLEAALLNVVNFQTLVATKAARVVMAARGEPVFEFGLRRAQGIDGALSASRAAYLGGCAATSNVLAGRLFGIPVKGTHAHSWVMCFDDELAAFRAYAQAMPNNCVFLVDTYNTLQGVQNAVIVAKELRAAGHEMVGIRLDSGDLAYLSIAARKILDDAGFPAAQIVASNDLDEHIIVSLKDQGAKIGVWGVGTRLATAFDEPALGGVYKLSAIRQPGGSWEYKVKLSEQAVKISNPGVLQVRRYSRGGQAIGDMIFDVASALTPGPDHSVVPANGRGEIAVMVDPLDMTRRKAFSDDAAGSETITREDLLMPIFRLGKRICESPTLEASRARVVKQLASFHDGVKRFVNPHKYPVGLELGLHERKTALILKTRGYEE